VIPTRTAVALQLGDLVAIGRSIDQVRDIASRHEASILLTFNSGERITVRRVTELFVVGNEPLPPPKRKRGRPPS
jgi:hypothetical protein